MFFYINLYLIADQKFVRTFTWKFLTTCRILGERLFKILEISGSRNFLRES